MRWGGGRFGKATALSVGCQSGGFSNQTDLPIGTWDEAYALVWFTVA